MISPNHVIVVVLLLEILVISIAIWVIWRLVRVARAAEYDYSSKELDVEYEEVRVRPRPAATWRLHPQAAHTQEERRPAAGRWGAGPPPRPGRFAPTGGVDQEGNRDV
ncbi:hypothetical protein F4677DRAFT_350752 [Hypoxylon crocopeplum]|nr:hypothetical protein F4677DRAFT_350752 [Hypoxylon crocopeplum]